MIGHGKIEAEQGDDAAYQRFGPAQGQMEH